MAKIIFYIFFHLLFVSSFFINSVSAAGPDISSMTGEVAKQGGYSTAVTEYSLSETIGQIIKVIISLVGTIFFVLTVYAGFLWMTAGGEEEKITKATDILRMSVIGLIIVMASYGITSFIVTRVRTVTTPGQIGK